MDDRSPLDRDLFDRILARAIELDAERGDTPLHEEDLLEAGRELGIDDRITRAAFVEVYGGHGEAVIEKPFDSPITLETSASALRLRVPPLAVGGSGMMLFQLVWAAFLLLWTVVTIASGGWGTFTALFSAAMALVILAQVRQRTEGAREHVELDLAVKGGELVHRRGASVRRQAFEVRYLRSRVVPAYQDGSARRAAHIELEYGTRTFELMTGRSMAELRWVGATISAWLRKHRR